MAENLADVPDLTPGQDVILPLEKPIKATGHLQILYGNMAPEGSVAKITGGWVGGWVGGALTAVRMCSSTVIAGLSCLSGHPMSSGAPC